MTFDRIIRTLNARTARASLCELAEDTDCQECLRDLQQVRPHEVSYALQPRSYEFGLKLLLAIIYVARREATEGQIWPAVRAELHLSTQVEDILFLGNGQPREEVKALIEKTCKHFPCLRHIFGQDGTKENFASIYLQFGFTRRGFTKMLPEWLMGYNQPNTIARLLDDPELKSESFRKLWKALLSFRRGNAAESVTRRIISESPWALLEWTDELLLAARKKPHLSPATSRSGSGEVGEAPRSFLSEPRLVVGSKLAEAQWQIELADLAELGLSGTSFCVRLRCGELVAQEVFLRRQPDGSLSNLTHNFEFPLASVKESQVSASITDQQGREVAAQDIHLFDPDADILAFSERGYLDDGFVKRGPRNALCFVLVRVGLNLTPQPAEWHRFEGMGYKLHRLHLEAGDQLRVLFGDGDELWSSVTGNRCAQPALSGGITPKCELSPSDNASMYSPGITEIVLRVSGINGAEILSAQWRSLQLRIEQPQPATQLPWRIGGIPKLEALLASRVLLKLRVQLNESVYRTEIEWKPSAVGIFEQSRGRASCGEFFATRNNEQLKRGRYTIMPKPLTLEQQERGLRWCLFEGERFVSELREGSPQSLYDLGAYGQGLSIRLGQFNREDKPTILIGEVADKGLFHIYAVNPFSGRDYTFDAWGTSEMGGEHTLHYGAIHERATSEVAGERLVFADDKAMFAPFPAQPCDYLVLAYAGVRLAAWWRVLKDGNSWSSNLAEIRDDVDARRAAFTIRWAKLPILSNDHYRQVKEFFRRFPHIVLGEWLCDCKERKDGRRIEGENTEAWHDAVRAIIQGYQIEHDKLTAETKQKLIQCLPDQPTEDVNAKILDTFQAVGACDPVLMGRMICYWLTTDASVQNRHNMGLMLLIHQQPMQKLHDSLRSLAPNTDDVFFERLFDRGIKGVTNPVLDPLENNNLKSALTLAPFRQLLYRQIVTHFLPTHKHP